MEDFFSSDDVTVYNTYNASLTRSKSVKISGAAAQWFDDGAGFGYIHLIPLNTLLVYGIEVREP